MLVNYKGATEDFNYRLAEINFDDNEYKKLERIAFLMKIKGWEIEIGVLGYATCKVENKKEYKEFMKNWKDSKRCITNSMKYFG